MPISECGGLSRIITNLIGRSALDPKLRYFHLPNFWSGRRVSFAIHIYACLRTDTTQVRLLLTT